MDVEKRIEELEAEVKKLRRIKELEDEIERLKGYRPMPYIPPYVPYPEPYQPGPTWIGSGWTTTTF